MSNYSIRYFDYLDEYLKLLLEYYAPEQNGILCTYYHFDYENSIMDGKETDFNKITRTGSYDLFGELSGYKWNKILYFPVYYTTNTSYDNNYNEFGKTKDINITVTFPDNYELVPNELDFIYFISDFQMKDLNTPIFKIDKISNSHFGKHKFYQLSLNTHYTTIQKLDNQLNETYMFIEPFKKIYQINNAEVILKTFQIWNNLSVNNIYNNFYEKHLSMFKI